MVPGTLWSSAQARLSGRRCSVTPPSHSALRLDTNKLKKPPSKHDGMGCLLPLNDVQDITGITPVIPTGHCCSLSRAHRVPGQAPLRTGAQLSVKNIPKPEGSFFSRYCGFAGFARFTPCPSADSVNSRETKRLLCSRRRHSETQLQGTEPPNQWKDVQPVLPPVNRLLTQTQTQNMIAEKPRCLNSLTPARCRRRAGTRSVTGALFYLQQGLRGVSGGSRDRLAGGGSTLAWRDVRDVAVASCRSSSPSVVSPRCALTHFPGLQQHMLSHLSHLG